MTLTEFLLARIAEDEGVARELDLGQPEADDSHLYRGEGRMVLTYPARVLAECQAKRHIVELCASAEDRAEQHPDISLLKMPAAVYGVSVRVLAAVYADHPDYSEAWRP
jgi:hypothetical protein